jgi:hypothetical protein
MPSDTAPYPVTITLAIVAWLFTFTIDEILKAPYLVYSIKTETNAKDSSLVDTAIKLANITDDKVYKNIIITLIIDQPDEIILDYPHGVRPEQPNWEGDTAPSVTKASFQHTFPIIQPDGQFNILFTHRGPDTRHVHIMMKYQEGKAADAVLLTKPNPATWLVENHVFISVAAMIALLIFLLSVGLSRLCRRKET